MNPHPCRQGLDFESSASASSATPAWCLALHSTFNSYNSWTFELPRYCRGNATKTIIDLSKILSPNCHQKMPEVA